MTNFAESCCCVDCSTVPKTVIVVLGALSKKAAEKYKISQSFQKCEMPLMRLTLSWTQISKSMDFKNVGHRRNRTVCTRERYGESSRWRCGKISGAHFELELAIDRVCWILRIDSWVALNCELTVVLCTIDGSGTSHSALRSHDGKDGDEEKSKLGMSGRFCLRLFKYLQHSETLYPPPKLAKKNSLWEAMSASDRSRTSFQKEDESFDTSWIRSTERLSTRSFRMGAIAYVISPRSHSISISIGGIVSQTSESRFDPLEKPAHLWSNLSLFSSGAFPLPLSSLIFSLIMWLLSAIRARKLPIVESGNVAHDTFKFESQSLKRWEDFHCNYHLPFVFVQLLISSKSRYNRSCTHLLKNVKLRSNCSNSRWRGCPSSPRIWSLIRWPYYCCRESLQSFLRFQSLLRICCISSHSFLFYICFNAIKYFIKGRDRTKIDGEEDIEIQKDEFYVSPPESKFTWALSEGFLPAVRQTSSSLFAFSSF